MSNQDCERVLAFWLGDLDADGLADEAHTQQWWKKSAAFDQELRKRFSADHEAIVAGLRDDWLTTPRGRLAYVIVLDQFSRNMFRDTPKMFASDGNALAATLVGQERGDDRELQTDERVFLYMPLMHSEALAMQERGVGLFAALHDELTGPARTRVANNLRFAIAHRDIVARFGRFPHRNRILGRSSTDEEVAFLKTPGSSF